MTTKPVPDLKAQARVEIERHRSQLISLSHRIHSHPEMALKEQKAVAWLTDELKANGFSIQSGICDMPTAFRASYGKGKPYIAFLAEYDALPELGHACGHNLIAMAAMAAAIGTKPAVDRLGGQVLVIGTPAEELSGGKITMVARGAFDDLDAVMMLHPSSHDTATIKALACASLEVEFFGKEAHAAAHPEVGINALEAMVQAYNAINSLRQHIEDSARIHGIITDGGKAANIVPAHSQAHFLVRAEDDTYLAELKGKVLDCFRGAAISTGARLEYRWGENQYASMRNNQTLAQLFVDNMSLLGHPVPLYNPDQSFGSTDTGNVSQKVPAIHASIAIAPPDTGEHTPEFARLAAEEKSHLLTLEGAAALAMTAIDLLADPDKLAAVRDEFKSKRE